MTTPEIMPTAIARRFLMNGAGLAAPARPATPKSLQKLIDSIGFVQVDTINVLERAHHLIIWSRMPAYRREHLSQLLERERSLFEHWTHDASIIPTELFPHWKRRFARYAHRDPGHAWWRARFGDDPKRVMAGVRERIERDGPLMSRAFERPDGARRADAWWNWKPAKAALEHLWRCGELMVSARVNFQKVYDLTERVFPDHHAYPASEHEPHVDWACRSALERLGVATPREIAAFWNAVSLADARAWCAWRREAGELVEVIVKPLDDSKPTRSITWADWKKRASRLKEAPPLTRLLCPFDPVLRDRARAKRLFNFDYRFEAFVPAAKRVNGYYVMAILEGDRLVGRFDPKFDRERGILRVRGLQWEKSAKPTRARRANAAEAMESLREWLGADRLEMATS